MKKTITILALMCISLTAMAKQAKTVTLRLIETSDVHGAFFPYNFTERRPMEGTMARVSTYLKRQRKTYGESCKDNLPATIPTMSRLTNPISPQRLSTTCSTMPRTSATTT